MERRIDGAIETYTYDTASNRLLSVLAGGVTRSFTYGGIGNVTQDDVGGNATTLTYNSTGRLVQVSAGTVVLVDYVYGANGQRAVKTTPTATTHYLYEPGGALFAETDGAGNVNREYITLGGVTLAVIDASGTSYVHADHMGTGQKMTGAGGAVVWDATYRPFGEVTITAAAATLNQRLPGQYADTETGYYDNWNRSYDPSLGRYLQADPMGLAGGLNLYSYAGGDPVSYADPTGEYAILGAVIGGGGNLAYQLWKNNGDINCVNWWEVGEWALMGSGFGEMASIVRNVGVRGIRRFFWDGREFKTISKEFWKKRGGANGQSLDHWLFSQRQVRNGTVPKGLGNAGFNLIEMSGKTNTWLGFAQNWGRVARMKAAAARTAIASFLLGAPVAGVKAGLVIHQEATKQAGCNCK